MIVIVVKVLFCVAGVLVRAKHTVSLSRSFVSVKRTGMDGECVYNALQCV